MQFIHFFYISQGLALVIDKGSCRSKDGRNFSRCYISGRISGKSKDGCQAACISLEVCLAINYNKVSGNCFLITTSKPTNGCPKGSTWEDTGVFAKSADDIKNYSNPNGECYAKIQVDKKERR